MNSILYCSCFCFPFSSDSILTKSELLPTLTSTNKCNAGSRKKPPDFPPHRINIIPQHLWPSGAGDKSRHFDSLSPGLALKHGSNISLWATSISKSEREVRPCVNELGGKDGKGTVLWQGGSKERGLDSWRGPNLGAVHQQPRPW